MDFSDSFLDPSVNFLSGHKDPLESFFCPEAIAVIGASETPNSVGRAIMQNLNRSFKGEIIPVNPKRDSVFEKKAYADITKVPGKIDLVLIATPAKTVPKIIQGCIEKKIPAAVIFSAGFSESGETGALIEKEVTELAQGKIRIIGPNCLGIMNPSWGLNATFAADGALDGNLAFISQSGALGTAVLDWSLQEQVGFRFFASIGAMIDVKFADFIHYFGKDPKVKSILIYMESIRDPRSFLSAAREIAMIKPIILIKAGRTEKSSQAAASHTGALAGSDEVMSAALARAGVLRVDSISDLFGMAEVLAKQPRPKGPRLTIITNAGGPGVIATDALIQNGGKLAEISSKDFDEFLPASWSHSNPIDILGDAGADTYVQTLETALKDPKTDGFLVILTPQEMTDPTQTAKALAPFAQMEKPLIASWMGKKRVMEGTEILISAGIPVFAYPDAACRMFSLMWRYSDQLQELYQTPEVIEETEIDRESVAKIFAKARKENRTILDEAEAKQVLKAYGIPTVPTEIAKSPEEAASIATSMGFPVVVKLYSHTITHKSDVGGVKLNLTSKEAVQKAFEEISSCVSQEDFSGVTVQPMISQKGYELILGSFCDELFGPVVVFGSGGELVEVMKDRELTLAPLNRSYARRMIERTKAYQVLRGVRGRKAVDQGMLEELLVRLSLMVHEQKWIAECDINPLLASEEGFIALDARIILQDDEAPVSAICPYPSKYAENWQGDDALPYSSGR